MGYISHEQSGLVLRQEVGVLDPALSLAACDLKSFTRFAPKALCLPRRVALWLFHVLRIGGKARGLSIVPGPLLLSVQGK
jgi:hypothetical protein